MRISNWDVALVEFVEEIRGLPFEWGKTDCATVVRRAMHILYGRDVFEDVEQWESRDGALRVALDLDVGALLARLGTEVQLKFAHAGDIALGPPMDGEGTPRLAVVLFRSKVLVSTLEIGVAVIPVSDLLPDTRFFRVQ